MNYVLIFPYLNYSLEFSNLIKTTNMFILYFCATIFVAVGVHGNVVNYEEVGGLADDFGLETAWNNGRILNQTLSSLQPGQNKFITK